MSKNKIKNPIIIYTAVWVLCVLLYWLFAFGYDGWSWFDTYNLMTFYIILPLATLTSAFFTEMKRDLGEWRLVVIAGHSIMYAAAEWATYALSTAVGMTKIGSPTWFAFIPGLFLSTVGFILWHAAHVFKKHTVTENSPDKNVNKSV